MGVQRGRCDARRRSGRALALALLVGLGACVSPGPPALAPDLLAPYVQRVARVRGGAQAPVLDARLVAPEEVRERIEHEMARVVGPEERAATAALLRVLGLIEPGLDPWTLLLDLQVQTVAGFYTALDRRLYVVARGGQHGAAVLSDPLVAEVLVHELAHAFQDAASVLPELGLGLDGYDDVAFALAGVLEGDALWTEHQDAQLIRGELPPDAEAYLERFAVDVEAAFPEGSPWIRAMFLRPYPLGYRFVRRAWKAGGQAALERMLEAPPLSSAALLHPERAVSGREEIEASPVRFAPAADCRLRATSSLGEIGLVAWLATDPRLPGTSAVGVAPPAAVEAWRADRAWLLDCPAGEAWAWLVQLDRPEAARILELEMRERAASLPARVERAGARLLLHHGLDEAGRRWLLGRAPVRHYADLSEWLVGHPEVEAAVARARDAPD